MYKHLDLCKNWTFIWRCLKSRTPYVVISAATSSFHPVPSVAMKCIRDQAAMATAKMKTRIVNRFACRSSLADASDGSFLSQCDCDVGQTTRTPRFWNVKSQIQWDQLFPSFSIFFPSFFSFSVDSMYRCILYDLNGRHRKQQKLPIRPDAKGIPKEILRAPSAADRVPSDRISRVWFGICRKYMEIYGNIWINNDQKVAKEFYNPMFGPKWLGNL